MSNKVDSSVVLDKTSSRKGKPHPHIGTPRTEECRKKISEATKGRVAYNKGKKELVKHVYYTDGNISIRIPESESPPDGFHRGRLKRKLTEDEKEQFNHKRAVTCLTLYGDKNYNNSKKNAQTKLTRHGSKGYNNIEKRKQTCLDKYGVDNPSKVEEFMCKAAKKSKETACKRGTICASMPEELFYEYLIDKYGKEDVIRQYKDIRYPFYCDFYVKSQDLFIELNLHWCHGFHPFNPNDQKDLDRLHDMQCRAKEGKKSYYSAIKCWTVSDPMKLNIANKNKLNYITIYNTEKLLAHIKRI